ncbi:alpha/beta-hydrolase [Aspergillus heteromorphus CBS 117.55]|uniref:Alpha/beta-hydrolase n=1 Tax=Aspergillus heteromorphus CBS 117.55 TaxID=1448321 RepID=A0A317WEA6_9EURO|nr:alpha/beta-hydrolase [Aspergillus heteromorphus CBS 117.55]PWY83358.1 alpha/beta-hydrolase [Aspergillus heteromorphus CBS 117.55]
MTPTIFFVPGFWEGPSVFEHVASLLRADGFTTEITTLPSTGTVSPGNPSMADDVAAIREHLTKVVERGEEVILVLHSGGGILGSEAMKGLDKTARGGNGGVVKIVFLVGAVFPEGHEHQPLPFAVVEGGACYCAQPEVLLLDDLAEADKGKWLAALKPQPAEGWDGKVNYTGWKDVPSVYLICEGDKLLPVPLQEQLAGLAGSEIERCSAGHMPQLSQPDRVVEVIKAAAI